MSVGQPHRPQLSVRYKLTEEELAGLKVHLPDPWALSTKVYSVAVGGLRSPARRDSCIQSNPFAGRCNVRLSSVRFWIPGLRVVDGNNAAGTKPTIATTSRLQVELLHEGLESMVDPDDTVWTFKHHPLHMAVEYDWRLAEELPPGRGLEDTVISCPNMSLDAGEIIGNSLQVPVGPFTTWRVTVRESANGALDFKEVKEAYLEFACSYMPFRR